jgi:periplasmic protein CpxP/Spy
VHGTQISTRKDYDMNHQHESTVSGQSAAARGRGRRWAAAGITAMIFGALSVTGISFADEGPQGGPGHGRGHGHERGMGMHGPMDPDKAAAHIDRMLARVVPDATADQKTRLTAIAKAAFTDLRPLHEKHRAARAKAMELLTQSRVDRTALEQARAADMQTADQISKRMTQAMADAAEVLTPAQRAKAAEHFKNRMNRMR